MRRYSKWFGFFLIIAIIPGFLPSCRKQAAMDSQPVEKIVSSFKPKPRNVGLVLDISGSMNQTDSRRMMLYSAMLFTDLLEDNDRLTIITIPDKTSVGTASQLESTIRTWITSPENMTTGVPKSDMKQWIKGLQYNANFTIFKEPLHKAIGAVSGGTDDSYSKRAIVFFSDGATDRHNPPPGSPQALNILASDHAAETEAIRSEVVPRLVKGRIGFYGVVLGQDTAANHFEIMAEATGGLVRKASNPEDLAANFTEVFSRILQTKVENLTLYTGRTVEQTINNYVKELLIIVPTENANKALRLKLHMTEPAGTKLSTSQDIHTGDKGQSDDDIWARTVSSVDGLSTSLKGVPIEAGGYAIWRIRKPHPGEWKIRLEGSSPASCKAIIIQNYGIHLEVEGSRNRFGMVGEPNAFKAKLITEDGEPITDPAFYKEQNFRFEFLANGKKIEDVQPDTQFRMMYDYVPPEAGTSKIEIAAKNDLYLDTKVLIDFTTFKDVALNIKGAVDLGERIPWTDWFLEGMGRLLGEKVWKRGSYWKVNPATADFTGSQRNAEGVRFKIDNTELYRRMKARVFNEDGGETFYLDKDMQAMFLIDIDRDSPGGDLSQIAVPITTVSGKPVSGVTNLPLKGTIMPLSPWSWKYSHLWLEELIILWLILFFVGKPFVYITRNSFSRSKRYFFGSYERFEDKSETPDTIADQHMGRSIFLRFPGSYFQFLWGTQVASGPVGPCLRQNPVSRLLWFVLAIFLPISMADKKKIGPYTFYRYRGETLISEKEDKELLFNERKRVSEEELASASRNILVLRDNVNNASVNDGTSILYME